jgi:hypothetical protein
LPAKPQACTIEAILNSGARETVSAIRLSAASAAGILAVVVLVACQPTVAVKAPEEPITINLNIKLDAEVRVKLEEKAEEDIQENPDIF